MFFLFSIDSDGHVVSSQEDTTAQTASSQGKVNPYSVIDITPLQQQVEQQHGLSSSVSSPSEPKEAQDIHSSPIGITSGYSVPVPCGYATPSGVPLITPAYTTPIIFRHLSVDEDGNVKPPTGETHMERTYMF